MRCVCGVICLPLVVVSFSGDRPGPDASKPANPRWLERLDGAERACLERRVGYAPPPFPQDASWPGGDALSWPELRGKVVVLQSWTCLTGAGRNWPRRAIETTSELGDDVVLIAVHTPHGADLAESYLERHPLRTPVMIDPGGSFCDALGLYDRPLNVVVDRNGSVRYAGLKIRGLGEAVAALIDEPHDPKEHPDGAPDEEPARAVEFPPHVGGVRSARDIRGSRAPNLAVQQWLTAAPDISGKVVVLDFWATWCGPCRSSIPHMNKLAERFRDDAVCIGLSDESQGKFQQGLKKYRLDPSGFKYPLALDPTRTMSKALQIRGIPHTMVVDSNWVVRWQGHPLALTEQTLGQIVEANNASGNGGLACARWTAEKG